MQESLKLKKNELHLSQKILIADDDTPTRVLLRAAVSQWGFQITEAKDGEEAWEILQQPEAPNLLILDWQMPNLDGGDLCIRIRKKLSQQPYIILLTQIAGTANIIKGLEAGADEFLTKPFNMAELHTRVLVGQRIIQYKMQLAGQSNILQKQVAYNAELKEMIKTLEGKIYQLTQQAGVSNVELKNQLNTLLQIIAQSSKTSA